MYAFLCVSASVLALYLLYVYKRLVLKNVPYLRLAKPYVHVRFPRGPKSKFLPDSMDVVEYYSEMKQRGYKFAGVVTSLLPVVIVKDLEIINSIYKDLSYFDDRGFHWTEHDNEYVEEKLVYLDERDWRDMMGRLSPSTTPEKLKTFLPAVVRQSERLVDALDSCAGHDVDVREFLACFTATLMVSYGCNLDFNGFKSGTTSKRRPDATYDLIKLAASYLPVNFAGRVTEEDMAKYLYATMRKYMVYHEANRFADVNVVSIELQLHDWSKLVKRDVSIVDMITKMNMFLYGSFDTASTTTNFAVYELCRNPYVQDKLRDEINDVLSERQGTITWEAVMDMKYLSQVINETLRMYPPAANLIKAVNEAYELKDVDVTLPKRTEVIVPLFCLHRDEDYFANPDVFEPERFNTSRIPFFMPFGGGLTSCLSIQATLMLSKLVLIAILRNFRLTISPRTKLPLDVDPKTYVRATKTLYVVAERL